MAVTWHFKKFVAMVIINGKLMVGYLNFTTISKILRLKLAYNIFHSIFLSMGFLRFLL